MTAFQKQEYGRKIMNRFTRKYIVALLLGVLPAAIPGSRMAVGLEIVEEEIGSGSVYGLFLQDGWNGDLALYAHGYVDASSPIGSFGDFRYMGIRSIQNQNLSNRRQDPKFPFANFGVQNPLIPDLVSRSRNPGPCIPATEHVGFEANPDFRKDSHHE